MNTRRGAVAVDTNVAVVANTGERECKVACIEALQRIVAGEERIALDDSGEILAEYRRHLRPSGQPGIGDRFYQHVIQRQGDERHVALATLKKVGDVYTDWPNASELRTFDYDDRKFALVARDVGGSVLNAVDSDWFDYEAPLREHGFIVRHLCARRVRQSS